MEKQLVLDYSNELKKIGIENEIVSHPSFKKPIEVLSHFNLDLSYGSATMIMKADDKFVAIIRRDDCKLNLKRIKKLLHVSDLRIANDEEFVKVTGVKVGTARVYTPGLKTIIDPKVFEKDFLIGGSGSFEFSIKIKTELLKKLPGYQVADVADIAVATESMDQTKQRVFSGIRATGRLHIGNYLGAVKGMLELQNSNKYEETIFCVVDVHSITTPFDPKLISENKREILIDYLAAGLDPEKSILIYQSSVPQHTELAFYFSSIVSIGKMQDLPTFKDKVRQHPKHTTMALLNYPILMAADILVYKAGLVPVGIDQEPHLEVARDIARRMNQLYSMNFPEPRRFATKGEYVPSLKGEGKMGKSIEGSFINLTDSLDEIRKKVRSIPTATLSGGEMSPGVKSLFIFADLFIPEMNTTFKSEYEKGSLQFSTMKDAVAEGIYKELKPFQEKRAEIVAKPEYVDKVINEGAERARKIAQKTVDEVKEKMGLG